MTQFMLILAALSIAGCATAVPRPTASASFDLKTTPEKAFKSLVSVFAENGFTIRLANEGSGLISTDPKEFSISRGMLGVPWSASVEVQAIFRDGRLKTQMTFRCRYGEALGVNTVRDAEICRVNDSDANAPIASEQARIETLIKNAL